MKKVTLLGDSIRLIGYGKKVPEFLGDEYEVFQPQDNCRFVKHTYRMIYDIKDKIAGSDVIHWNNAHWDTCIYFPGDGPFSTLEEYVSNMVRLAKLLKTLAPVVIFATATPIKEPNSTQENEIIDKYSAAVVPELEKIGIIINDLGSFVKPHAEEYICDDRIHLSEAGINACAKEVSDFIKATLEK